ncbi:MAG: hypothetical protein R3E97_14325 [Candidatus Eisenbacteria bacterium]
MGMAAKDVKKIVQISDMVVMHEPFLEIGQKVVSKALDNRFACWLGIEAVRALDKSKTGHAAKSWCSRCRRRSGSAERVAANVRPDIGIGLDVTLACDTPDVPESEAVTLRARVASGLHVMDSSFISDHTLVKELEAVAKAKKIPYQRTILPAGGQDGRSPAGDGGCRSRRTRGRHALHSHRDGDDRHAGPRGEPRPSHGVPTDRLKPGSEVRGGPPRPSPPPLAQSASPWFRNALALARRRRSPTTTTKNARGSAPGASSLVNR